MAESSMNIRKITLIALMSAMIFVLTVVPRIPVPATGGYIHLGDAGITFAACAFGPVIAMAAGGLGTALADLMGYPQWAVFSFSFTVSRAMSWVWSSVKNSTSSTSY